MIGNNLEQSIISVFQDNLSSTYSINEVAKALKKSYPMINRKSNFFLGEGILKKINIGKSYQCFLNLDSEKAKILMAINELNKKEALLDKKPHLKNLISSIESISSDLNRKSNSPIVHTALLSGDDVIFVILDPSIIDLIQESVSTNAHQNAWKSLKPMFFTTDIFKEDLLNNSLLQKDHAVVYSVTGYLSLISSLSEKFMIKGMMQRTT